MAPRILVASTNRKKAAEMSAILKADLPELELLTLADFPDLPEVEESGATFMENAHIKAAAGAAHSNLLTISDDGGLCIDALEGRPGVQSHRFLGENTAFVEKMTRILEMLSDVPAEKRSCRFVCAVVIRTPAGSTYECTGTCEGRIGDTMKGSFGFGYDPIFYLPQLGRYMAELSPDEKQRVSHRGMALECATKVIRRIMNADSGAEARRS